MPKAEFFMARALDLAHRGFPATSPNPLVGCVLVKHGRIIAEGWHREFGGPHAEIEALNRLKGTSDGATAYVTLEPCSYWGNTPPCAEALIKAGVTSVVAAASDPNPRVRGRGLAILKKAGIKIQTGILEAEAKELNLPFWTQMALNRPYTALKAAVTLDGKIADPKGNSKWITSPQSRKALWKIRGLFEAILVGAGTIKKDNPELTTHGLGRNPLRIVLDPALQIPLHAKILNTQKARTLIFTSTPDWSKFSKILNKDVEILAIDSKNGELDLRGALKLLSLKGIQTLLVEGGGITHGHFIRHGLFDEILWFMAPKILGGDSSKTVVGGSGFSLSNAFPLKNLTAVNSSYEGDLILRASARADGRQWPILTEALQDD